MLFGTVLGVISSYLSPYLKQPETLHLIDRRIPVTIPTGQRHSSRKSRYHLADPYLRFYFRFLAPNLELVEQELAGLQWERIRTRFRAYVSATAFEELCREWTLVQARADKLPFPPRDRGQPLVQGRPSGRRSFELAGQGHSPRRVQMGRRASRALRDLRASRQGTAHRTGKGMGDPPCLFRTGRLYRSSQI